MTALVSLRTRLRTAKVALVVPPEAAGAEAADFAAHGADLLVLSRGKRSVDEAAAGLEAARGRLFGLTTLVAVDDLDVAKACAADVVFLRRPGWRPFGYTLPHQHTLLGRSIDQADEMVADPFSFAFLGTAVEPAGEVNPHIARAARDFPPLAIPAHAVWFAAGGITPDNVEAVLAAGARRIVVSTAVFTAGDPFAVTRQLADALTEMWRTDPLSQAYASDAFRA